MKWLSHVSRVMCDTGGTMFEKGSEWRRWDLHLHTPNTKKEDHYEGGTIEQKWDNFYAKVSEYVNSQDERKRIAAVGITDYLAIDNYLKIINDKRLPEQITGIFPNVEIRIIPTGKDSPVNMHFIFNPSFVGQLNERFFAKLKFNIDRPYSATREDLINLGRKLDDSLTTDESAYRYGIDQFVPTYSDVQNLFAQDAELRNNTLIGVTNGDRDGASGITKGAGGGQLSGTRLAIYKMCDFIFSSNDNNRLYFLGKGPDDESTVKSRCGSLKPCFHGSDAHSLERIFEPDLSRYCWIKADTTFDGLKQVIYEPEARVRIGELKPEEKSDYQVIDRVVINDAGFSNSPIEFNDKLTCIIGGKSTGKSLLLQNIARAIDNKQVEEKLAISGAASKRLKNVQVFWKDGDIIQEGDLDETHKIVYIPQTYLNRLSDENEKESEIDRIIQDIVLLDSETKYVYDKMGHLIKEFKPQLDRTIYEMLRVHADMKSLILERNEIGTESGITKEIEKLKSQKDLISKEASVSEGDISQFEDAYSEVQRLTTIIEVAIKDIKAIEESGLPLEKSTISADFSDEIADRIRECQEEILSITKEKWEERKKELINDISKKKNDAEIKREESNEIVKRWAHIIKENDAISKLSEQIQNEEKKLEQVKNLNKKILDKKSTYDICLQKLAEAIEEYETYHDNYVGVVNERCATDSDGLNFSASVTFRKDAFCSFLKESINNFSLKKCDVPYEVEDFSREALTRDRIKYFIESLVDGELKLLKNKTVESVLRDFLGDWFLTSYDVKMENDNISQMSPGKKALVLLKLLISLADSKCPILIDQPEDDLDNRSIYDELIPFIRKKKIERQIIVVTHNANVVLGGDAEEVIVANQDGQNSPNYKNKFEYRSGSIENSETVYEADGKVRKGVLNERGIQQHICSILEGGEAAFNLRKNKYKHIATI